MKVSIKYVDDRNKLSNPLVITNLKLNNCLRNETKLFTFSLTQGTKNKLGT